MFLAFLGLGARNDGLCVTLLVVIMIFSIPSFTVAPFCFFFSSHYITHFPSSLESSLLFLFPGPLVCWSLAVPDGLGPAQIRMDSGSHKLKGANRRSEQRNMFSESVLKCWLGFFACGLPVAWPWMVASGPRGLVLCFLVFLLFRATPQRPVTSRQVSLTAIFFNGCDIEHAKELSSSGSDTCEVRGPLAVRFRRSIFPRQEHCVLSDGSKVRRDSSSREQRETGEGGNSV